VAHRTLPRKRSVAGLVLFAVLFAAGCTVTPAQLATFETHDYAGRSQRQVYGAVVTSLKSLGYEVVLADKSAFRVKTAPKEVMVHASGGYGTATATSDSVAWTIDVTSTASGASLHAEPRLYSAGQSIEALRLNASFADRLFNTLYGEIDSNLPKGTAGGLASK
jgi:hypothetical protein